MSGKVVLIDKLEGHGKKGSKKGKNPLKDEAEEVGKKKDVMD